MTFVKVARVFLRIEKIEKKFIQQHTGKTQWTCCVMHTNEGNKRVHISHLLMLRIHLLQYLIPFSCFRLRYHCDETMFSCGIPNWRKVNRSWKMSKFLIAYTSSFTEKTVSWEFHKVLLLSQWVISLSIQNLSLRMRSGWEGKDTRARQFEKQAMRGTYCDHAKHLVHMYVSVFFLAGVKDRIDDKTV